MDDLIQFNIVDFGSCSDLVDGARGKGASIAFDMTVINMSETMCYILENVIGSLSFGMNVLNKVRVSVECNSRDVALEDNDVRVLDRAAGRLEEGSE